MPDTPTTPKANIKGCLSIILIIAGIAGLIYFVPQIAKELLGINPIDRQTIIIAILLLVMGGAK